MKRKSCFILLTAVLLMMLSVIPVSAKTAIVPGIVVNQEKGAKDWDYGMNVGMYGKAKWKSGTYSAELLLPADLFVKNNVFRVEGRLSLRDPSIDDRIDNPYIGEATSSSIVFTVNKSGKLSIKRYSNMKNKWVSMGSASVKAEKVSSGKYYLVTIKDIPFDNTYYPRDSDWKPEDAKKIPVNKYLNYSAVCSLYCWDKLYKTVKDCVYLVNFSCNTGTKNLKMNITGNFMWFDAWGSKNGKDFSVTKKIARVTY